MMDRLLSLVVALSLASLIWLYARSRDLDTLDNVSVPVEIRLTAAQADQYDLEIAGASQVTASFTGNPTRLRELRSMMNRGELVARITLTIPEDRLQESRYSDTVRVETADLHPPHGISVTLMEGRNRVPVTLHRLVERRLPVRVNVVEESQLAKVVVEPNTVLVRGPQEILERVRTIDTYPYSPQPLDESSVAQPPVARKTLPLVRELEGRPIRVTPECVKVQLTMRPKQKIYEITEVPVHFLCPSAFGLRPEFGDERGDKMTLKVSGPALEEPPKIQAYIDLTGRKFEAGLYADEPLKVLLPPDFQLAQNPPRSAAFRLVPIAQPNDPLRLSNP